MIYCHELKFLQKKNYHQYKYVIFLLKKNKQNKTKHGTNMVKKFFNSKKLWMPICCYMLAVNFEIELSLFL